MSSLDKMNLEESLSIITELFESVGIKSLIIKEENNEWLNLFTSFILSKRKVSQLEAEFSDIESRLGKIDHPQIKVILEAHPVDYLNTIIEEIKQNTLTVNQNKTKININEGVIQNKIFQKSHFRHKHHELMEFGGYSLILDSPEAPSHIFSNSGISPSVVGIKSIDDIAGTWLSIDGLGYAYSIIFMVPMYAKIISTLYQPPNSITCNIKMLKAFTPDTTIWINRKAENTNEITERESFKASSNIFEQQDEFDFLSITKPFANLNSNDSIEIIVQHNRLGILSEEYKSLSSIFRRNDRIHTAAFSLFNAEEKMLKNLIEPKTANDFETAVAWILQLFGLPTIKLSKIGEKLADKMTAGSADIISVASQGDKLYCIDCTSTSPPSDKIDKIRNTAEIISSKVNAIVKPVLFSPILCQNTKRDASDSGVRILDREDISKMIEIYQEGPDLYWKLQKILP